MPSNRFVLKARGKKLKYFANKNKKLEENDSDADLSEPEMDEEELSKYIGQFLNDKYIIIDYLNYGTFSKVWLVYNWEKGNIYVAKMFSEESIDEYKNELMMLKQYTSYDIESTTNITYVDNFDTTINKESVYILVLPYLGKSLHDYICDKEENDMKLSYQDIRSIMKKITYSVSKLHELNILHTDLKMDNLLTNVFENYPGLSQFLANIDISTIYYKYLKCNTPDDILERNKNRRKIIKRKIKTKTQNQISEYLNIKLNDYFSSIDSNQNNDSDSTDNSQNLNQIDESASILENDFKLVLTDLSNATIEKDIIDDEPYQIRAYRSAENILGIKYNIRSESWALGCILWEILTGEKIFEPNLNQNSIDRDREQLAIMETYLGQINKEITMECPRSYELYEDTGKIIKNKKIKRMELNEHLAGIRDDLSEIQIEQICTFLKKTWYYNHLKRLTAEELLKDEFLNIN